MWRRLAAWADRKNGKRTARYENRLDACARGRHGERNTLVGSRREDKYDFRGRRLRLASLVSAISMNAIREVDLSYSLGVPTL